MENSREDTIDLKVLFMNLLKHIRFIIVVSLVAAVVAFVFTKFFVPEMYTSRAQIYVDPRNDVTTETTINYNDLNAAEKLVSTCRILFTGDKMAEYVIEDLSYKYGISGYTITAVKNFITVEAATEGTSVMDIVVTTEDPEFSAIVANIVRERASDVYTEIVEGGVVKTVNDAMVPTAPSSPSVPKNVMLGFLIGLVLSCSIIIIMELVDTKVKPTDDIAQMYGIPVFAEILDFDSTVKGVYDYDY